MIFCESEQLLTQKDFFGANNILASSNVDIDNLFSQNNYEYIAWKLEIRPTYRTLKVTALLEKFLACHQFSRGARCSSVVRAFAHGAIGRQINPSWGGPIELFLVPASAPRLV